MKIKSYNPANNELLGEVKQTDINEIKNIVIKSRKAFETWGYLSLEQRIVYIHRLKDVIKSKKREFAELITNEMGMPISESLSDIDSGLEYIEWYINNVEKVIGDKITYEDEKEIDKIIFEPKGVAAVIIAWNFPFSSFVWQAVTNLIVGNTVIIKHSELVPFCSKFIYDMVNSVLPENVYNVVYGAGDVGKALVEQEIDLICFTGSTRTGQNLYKIAGEKFIEAVMECGGSAPGIVFEDAEVDDIIEAIYINKFSNSGQIRDGQKRLIVHNSKIEEVCNKLKLLVESKNIGNPLDEKTEIGPLVSKEQLEKIENQMADAIDKGAKVICGGQRLENTDGNYYLPTILTNITKEMKVYNEEVFGPVIPIIGFDTIEDAIELANDTEYGLGGYIYTKDRKKFDTVVKQLKTGMIAWNNLYYLKPCNPFGGYKKSGIGRNNSEFGLKELCNIKVITYEK